MLDIVQCSLDSSCCSLYDWWCYLAKLSCHAIADIPPASIKFLLK